MITKPRTIQTPKTVVDLVDAGGTLCTQIIGGRQLYWIEGKAGGIILVNKRPAEVAIKSRMIVPNDDGLFPGASQTWRKA